MKNTIHLGIASAPRGWLIGAPTKLADRAKPIVEEIYLPETSTLPGKLHIQFSDKPSIIKPPVSIRKKISAYVSPKTMDALRPDTICIDLRLKSPENWAHALTNHLPLALLLRRQFDTELTVILPEKISSKIVQLFNLCHFNTLTTDNAVTCRVIDFQLEPWIGIRGERCQIIREELINSSLKNTIDNSDQSLDKIFISRKDSRKLLNELDFEVHLAAKGYTKIYAENYSLEEQLSLITKAKSIISLHGAALGPLIFRSLNGESNYKLLEIFSPAHVTDVFRIIAAQTNGKWIGIRGTPWASLLSPKANFTNNLDNFYASIKSLETAMDLLDMN